MAIQRTGHVAIRVRDLDAAKRFYGDILGMKLGMEIPGQGLFFRFNDYHHDLAVFKARDGAEPASKNHAGVAHIAMVADDFATVLRVYRRLLEVIAEALEVVQEKGERWWEAEIHRLKGELLLKQDDPNTVEAQICFERAIEIAHRQSAKSLELRATISLVRLLAEQGRRDEAHAMLAGIYDWFTEGFDTPDLKDAKALLDEWET